MPSAANSIKINKAILMKVLYDIMSAFNIMKRVHLHT